MIYIYNKAGKQCDCFFDDNINIMMERHLSHSHFMCDAMRSNGFLSGFSFLLFLISSTSFRLKIFTKSGDKFWRSDNFFFLDAHSIDLWFVYMDGFIMDLIVQSSLCVCPRQTAGDLCRCILFYIIITVICILFVYVYLWWCDARLYWYKRNISIRCDK